MPGGGGAATAAAAAARIYSHNALQIPNVNLTSSNNWTHKRINDACFTEKQEARLVTSPVPLVPRSSQEEMLLCSDPAAGLGPDCSRCCRGPSVWETLLRLVGVKQGHTSVSRSSK